MNTYTQIPSSAPVRLVLTFDHGRMAATHILQNGSVATLAAWLASTDRRRAVGLRHYFQALQAWGVRHG